jgi:DNA helicase-2/ATP-dependent DNA helicase PcrA
LRAAIEIADTDELPARARGTLVALARDFARWRDDRRAHSGRTRPHGPDESGYTAALQAERSTDANGRLENLSELARAMEEYETLSDFLEHVSLVMDNDNSADEAKVT